MRGCVPRGAGLSTTGSARGQGSRTSSLTPGPSLAHGPGPCTIRAAANRTPRTATRSTRPTRTATKYCNDADTGRWQAAPSVRARCSTTARDACSRSLQAGGYGFESRRLHPEFPQVTGMLLACPRVVVRIPYCCRYCNVGQDSRLVRGSARLNDAQRASRAACFWPHLPRKQRVTASCYRAAGAASRSRAAA